MSGMFRRRSQQKEVGDPRPPGGVPGPRTLSTDPQAQQGAPTSPTQHKTRRATIFDNLFYPVSEKARARSTGGPEGSQLTESDCLVCLVCVCVRVWSSKTLPFCIFSTPQILQAARKRGVFHLTPPNQHLDLDRGGMGLLVAHTRTPTCHNPTQTRMNLIFCLTNTNRSLSRLCRRCAMP